MAVPAAVTKGTGAHQVVDAYSLSLLLVALLHMQHAGGQARVDRRMHGRGFAHAGAWICACRGMDYIGVCAHAGVCV